MSHNTGNELESSDILDFSDNCENLDVLMNADQEYWTDRLGNKRPTIDYALRMAGFTPAGFDFTTGGVLKNGDRNKCVFNQADQTWYSWTGDLPYNVIAGSAPGEGWKLWDKNVYGIAYQAICRSYAEVGLVVKGLFAPGVVVESVNDVLISSPTGKGYSYVGSFPHVVEHNESSLSPGWKDVSTLVVHHFPSVEAARASALFKGARVVVDNYYDMGGSGQLFFTVVPGGTGVDDGGKFIDLQNGLQLKQNIKLPADPRAWGAIGNGDRGNSPKDTKGVQNAINYGHTYIHDGKYVIDTTTLIKTNYGVDSSPGAQLEYINETGPCVYINNNLSTFIENGRYNIRILDNGKDRQNSWSVVCDKVATSEFRFEIKPGDDYDKNYSSLTDQQRLDLKIGLNVKGGSFTNSIKSKLYQAALLLESPDNEVVEPTVIWGNGRRWALKLLTASTRIQGIQLVPGADYGIYSDADDITHTQILDNYFDGNTKPQTIIPTGHVIFFEGNLRRSNITGNRFFIPGKRSIHVGGTLEASSISGGNFFSNGDSADLGFGDIYLGKVNGSVITDNVYFRDALAAKTGVARVQPKQPCITISNIGSEYDEPTIIANNSMMGTNFYADSSYPPISSVLTKNNHKKIHNKNTFVCRYSDNLELKVYQTALTQVQLDSLPPGEVYTNSLGELGITGIDDPSGYVRTTRVQDSSNLSILQYGKQEVFSNKNKMFTRMLVNNEWSPFRQI